MNVGLIDVDSQKPHGKPFPNLALMKISAWHKAQGDNVEWCMPLLHYDRVYQSKVFDDTYTQDIDWTPQTDEIIKGGTGYSIDSRLPDEIEHIMPDYSLYGITDTAYGYLTRGCPRGCPFCIVAQKEGRASRKVADLSEFWDGQPNITLLDPNLLACHERMDLLRQVADSGALVDYTQGLDARLMTAEIAEAIGRTRFSQIHFAWDDMKQSKAVISGLKLYAEHAARRPHGSYAGVYVLTNYGTTMEDNLYRIYTLRDMGYDPYVMVYDKPHAPEEIKRLQGWVNNKIIFNSGTCERFEDFERM